MNPQAYYNRIVVLGHRGTPTYAEALRDLNRLNETLRARAAA
jgi:hypothetical protein